MPDTPKPGHDTFVTIANAMLEARDEHAKAGTLYETFDLGAIYAVLLVHGFKPPRARVLVTVQGGSADVQTVGPVDYELLDFDNLEAEGLNFEERDARYQQEAKWLETGELPPDDDAEEDDGESDITDEAPPETCQHFETKDGVCVGCGVDLMSLATPEERALIERHGPGIK